MGKARQTTQNSFRIDLFDGLGMHVTKFGVVWFGASVGGNERGSFHVQLTQAQAFEKIADHMGDDINPTIGLVPPKNQHPWPSPTTP